VKAIWPFFKAGFLLNKLAEEFLKRTLLCQLGKSDGFDGLQLYGHFELCITGEKAVTNAKILTAYALSIGGKRRTCLYLNK
jgi:hypothetical protein